MAANKKQVGGTHYKVGGEEHWDRVDRLDLDYFQAQITKYVERWRDKGGVQDLEKAQHFLEKYIELAKNPDSSTYASARITRLVREGKFKVRKGKKVLGA